jgi:thymidylate synthase ThyX
MAPVALFIDGVSLWLAYYLWTLCPTAGGQESSTRYIKLSDEVLVSADALGIPEPERTDWHAQMAAAFEAYQQAVAFWEATAARDPDVARVPRALQNDPSEKAKRQIARMRRNYAFDRARYLLPTAAATNVMLLQSARAWTGMCQHLLSHALPEAQVLGAAVRDELGLAAPRMLKHAERKESLIAGLAREFEAVRRLAETLSARDQAPFDAPPTPYLDMLPPSGSVTGADFARDLELHDNRYAYVGETLRRTSVRFGWQAVAFAEIRDLNRHRTGTKYCPLVPQGFYHAADQVPENAPAGDYAALGMVGRDASTNARQHLLAGEPTYVYWTLLGTQFPFEHTTTADKFLYEAELRTGTGAHFPLCPAPARRARPVVRALSPKHAAGFWKAAPSRNDLQLLPPRSHPARREWRAPAARVLRRPAADAATVRRLLSDEGIGQFRFGSRRFVLVNAPQLLHEILVEQAHRFHKGPALSIYSRRCSATVF